METLLQDGGAKGWTYYYIIDQSSNTLCHLGTAVAARGKLIYIRAPSMSHTHDLRSFPTARPFVLVTRRPLQSTGSCLRIWVKLQRDLGPPNVRTVYGKLGF